VQALQLIHPLGIAPGGLRGLGGCQTKALDVDQAPDALGPHAGVEHDHVAAHAVAHQVDRRVGAVVVQQKIQVRHVVGEPVVVGHRAFGQAVAAPVGGDDMATLLAKGVHHELVRRAHIHPAMHHDQRGLAGHRLSPHAHVVIEVPHGHELAARCVFDWVHSVDYSGDSPCPSVKPRTTTQRCMRAFTGRCPSTSTWPRSVVVAGRARPTLRSVWPFRCTARV
jgi:hypothetical protein